MQVMKERRMAYAGHIARMGEDIMSMWEMDARGSERPNIKRQAAQTRVEWKQGCKKNQGFYV